MYSEVIFLINKASVPWKMFEKGNKIHSPNIPDTIQGHAEDCLCPIFLSREFKTSK